MEIKAFEPEEIPELKDNNILINTFQKPYTHI